MKRISFNENWIFCNGGSESAVTLPHDAMILEKRSPDNLSGSAGAFFPGGIYKYSKIFNVPIEWAGKAIMFQFEGVYRKSTVRLNGHEVGGSQYGYIPFFIEVSGFLKYGGMNTIEVEADNSQQPNSRWYSGGGIYRPVWLWIGEAEHIEPEGIQISTLSVNPPEIKLKITHNGSLSSVEIIDNGRIIASSDSDEAIISLPEASPWSADCPYLYECRATLSSGDTASLMFGIRKIEWNREGLFINGRKTLLRGGCIHHDNGIVGAADYPECSDRKVRILKAVGFNAIRSSHNPASSSFLSACDRYGLYVIDEAWDMWYKHKSAYDYASDFPDCWEKDLTAMVKRDRQHPSVIMYSIGNELSEPAEERGMNLARKMISLIHGLDPDRAVTAGINLMIISRSASGNDIYDENGNNGRKKGRAINSTVFNMMAAAVGPGMNKAANSSRADKAVSPVLDVLDIAGYNYASGRYRKDGKLHPDRVIYGSETFPYDIVKNWRMVEQLPYLVGDFMWSAWDYLGEAGFGAWSYTPDGTSFDKPYPWLLSGSGVIDILGNPTGELFAAQAAWHLLSSPLIAVRPPKKEKPVKSVWRGTNSIPSWSWRGYEGNRTAVEIYSESYAAELFINGRSLGRKRIRNCCAVFHVKYESGKLAVAVFDRNGQEEGRSELISAEGPLRIGLSSETSNIHPGSLVHIHVDIMDVAGVIDSNSDENVVIKVSGGSLIGAGSSNPRTEDSFITGSFSVYQGRGLAVIRAGAIGNLHIEVDGLTLGHSELVLAIR